MPYGQKIHLIRADSHKVKTLEQVKAILGGKGLDFLFIDGEHSYDGVIVSSMVLSMLGRLIEILTMTPRMEALKQGFEKVKSLIGNSLLTRMFPKILDWVKNLDYILYLGLLNHEFNLQSHPGIVSMYG